jgi:hypothetical protein
MQQQELNGLDDPHHALLASFVHAPLSEGLDRLDERGRTCVTAGTNAVVLGRCTEEGGTVTLGAMFDHESGDARWFLIHGGVQWRVAEAPPGDFELMLDCDPGAVLVHAVGVDARLQGHALYIRVTSEDVFW